MHKLRIIIASLLILSFFMPFSLSHSSRGDEGDYMVLLKAPNNEHYTEKNVYTYYTITVTNMGNFDDTYNLTHDTMPKYWQGSINVTTLFVPAGEFRNITFKIKPTCNCEEGNTTYINVTATSQSDVNVSDKIQILTTYIIADVDLSSQTVKIDIGADESQTVDITVTNNCELEDTFSLNVSHPQGIVAELSVDTVSLPGLGSTTITLNVSIPQLRHDGLNRVEIGAQSLHDNTKTDAYFVNVLVVSPDLYISSLYFSNNRPKKQENTTIFAEIENQGLLDATNVTVRFSYVHDNDTKTLIGSERESIKAGNYAVLDWEFTAKSDIKGFVMEIDFEGKYDNINQSFSIKEADFTVKEPDSPSALIFIILGVLIIIVVVLVIVLKKR